MNLSKLLQQRASAALRDLVDDPAPFAAMVRPAQDARFGDYQLNCAMPLAGKLKQKPRDVAEQIVSQLKVDDLCASVERRRRNAGPIPSPAGEQPTDS